MYALRRPDVAREMRNWCFPDPVARQYQVSLFAFLILVAQCTHMKDGATTASPPDKTEIALTHLVNVELFPVILIPSDDNAGAVAVNQADRGIVWPGP